jgi:hypothetical protein
MSAITNRTGIHTTFMIARSFQHGRPLWQSSWLSLREASSDLTSSFCGSPRWAQDLRRIVVK